jgi:hypothetical protein
VQRRSSHRRIEIYVAAIIYLYHHGNLFYNNIFFFFFFVQFYWEMLWETSLLLLFVFAFGACEDLYAAANGTGTSCSASIPCALPFALSAAPAGSVVHLLAGRYSIGTLDVLLAVELLGEGPGRDAVALVGGGGSDPCLRAAAALTLRGATLENCGAWLSDTPGASGAEIVLEDVLLGAAVSGSDVEAPCLLAQYAATVTLQAVSLTAACYSPQFAMGNQLPLISTNGSLALHNVDVMPGVAVWTFPGAPRVWVGANLTASGLGLNSSLAFATAGEVWLGNSTAGARSPSNSAVIVSFTSAAASFTDLAFADSATLNFVEAGSGAVPRPLRVSGGNVLHASFSTAGDVLLDGVALGQVSFTIGGNLWASNLLLLAGTTITCNAASATVSIRDITGLGGSLEVKAAQNYTLHSARFIGGGGLSTYQNTWVDMANLVLNGSNAQLLSDDALTMRDVVVLDSPFVTDARALDVRNLTAISSSLSMDYGANVSLADFSIVDSSLDFAPMQLASISNMYVVGSYASIRPSGLLTVCNSVFRNLSSLNFLGSSDQFAMEVSNVRFTNISLLFVPALNFSATSVVFDGVAGKPNEPVISCGSCQLAAVTVSNLKGPFLAASVSMQLTNVSVATLQVVSPGPYAVLSGSNAPALLTNVTVTGLGQGYPGNAGGTALALSITAQQPSTFMVTLEGVYCSGFTAGCLNITASASATVQVAVRDSSFADGVPQALPYLGAPAVTVTDSSLPGVRLDLESVHVTGFGAAAGAGITFMSSASASARLTLMNCSLSNLKALNSAVLYLPADAMVNVTATNCLFVNNSAQGFGGVVELDGRSRASVAIAGGSFVGNHAYAGGVVALAGEQPFSSGRSGVVALIGCDASGNGADEYGGVVYMNLRLNARPGLLVRDCRFTGNWAQVGGVGYVDQNSMLSTDSIDELLTRLAVSGNTYIQNRGALAADDFGSFVVGFALQSAPSYVFPNTIFALGVAYADLFGNPEVPQQMAGRSCVVQLTVTPGYLSNSSQSSTAILSPLSGRGVFPTVNVNGPYLQNLTLSVSGPAEECAPRNATYFRTMVSKEIEILPLCGLNMQVRTDSLGNNYCAACGAEEFSFPPDSGTAPQICRECADGECVAPGVYGLRMEVAAGFYVVRSPEGRPADLVSCDWNERDASVVCPSRQCMLQLPVIGVPYDVVCDEPECGDGCEDFLCARCADGYYATSHGCLECDSRYEWVAWVVSIGFFVITVILTAVASTRIAVASLLVELLFLSILYLTGIVGSSVVLFQIIFALVLVLSLLSQMSGGVGVETSLQIIVFAGQTAAEIFDGYVPPTLSVASNFFVNLFNLRLGSLDCLVPALRAGSITKLILILCVPLIFGVPVAFVMIARRAVGVGAEVVAQRRGAPKTTLLQKLRLRESFEELLKVLFFVLTTAYFDVLESIFAVFSCRTFSDDDLGPRMASAPWQLCSGDHYNGLRATALVGMGVYLVCVPLLYAGLLAAFYIRNRRLVRKFLQRRHVEQPARRTASVGDDAGGAYELVRGDVPEDGDGGGGDVTATSASTSAHEEDEDEPDAFLAGFLVEGFRFGAAWFALLWLARRVLVAAALALAPAEFEFAATITVLVAAAALTAIVRPFEHAWENSLDVLLLLTLVGTYAAFEGTVGTEAAPAVAWAIASVYAVAVLVAILAVARRVVLPVAMRIGRALLARFHRSA